jgi:hypothetical protein
MSRYRIVFRVEDEAGRHVVNDRQVVFSASGGSVYDHIAPALLIIAKLIKAALSIETADATSRA